MKEIHDRIDCVEQFYDSNSIFKFLARIKRKFSDLKTL